MIRLQACDLFVKIQLHLFCQDVSEFSLKIAVLVTGQVRIVVGLVAQLIPAAALIQGRFDLKTGEDVPVDVFMKGREVDNVQPVTLIHGRYEHLDSGLDLREPVFPVPVVVRCHASRQVNEHNNLMRNLKGDQFIRLLRRLKEFLPYFRYLAHRSRELVRC